MRLFYFLLLISFSVFSQEHNPLPPGPSTISAMVCDTSGKGLSNATVTVKYADGQQRSCDTFKVYDGYFTAYIFRYDQAYIDLEISINGKICKTIRYNNPGMGMNLGHPMNKIICNPATTH